MSVHKYPPLSADSLVQHLNVYLGTEIVDEHELLSTETTQQVFVMLVYRLTGISVSSEDQEQQSPGGYAPTSNQDKQVALLSFALPSLLKAANVNCPITISDICSQLAPDRTKRLLDVLSGLVNLLVYYQKCTKTQLDKVNSEIQALTDREKALCARPLPTNAKWPNLKAQQAKLPASLVRWNQPEPNSAPARTSSALSSTQLKSWCAVARPKTRRWSDRRPLPSLCELGRPS
ncbi:hypothetical protein BOX15_Mlig019773g3 [Macrostomum lignano]|uniref:Uncharacterized protein n=1 Tax=Macrostomum lignano TaxID=282301 RepID=A0A267EBE9_9PLAT|nr:hypothetical protein BOX15_Mlig019773g3 [Macrostomum lignano]